jgi:hypothetical protein
MSIARIALRQTATQEEESPMSIREAISRTLYGFKALDARILGQIIVYPYRRAYSSAKFGKVRGAQQAKGSALRGIRGLIGHKEAQSTGHPEEYAFPGRVLAHQWQSRQRIELICENALVRIDVLAPDPIRVRVSPSGRFPPPFSYAVAKEDKEWAPVGIAVEETEDALLIRTAKLCCRADKAGLALTFLAPDGTVISADAPGAGWDPRGEQVACWKRLPPDEHVHKDRGEPARAVRPTANRHRRRQTAHRNAVRPPGTGDEL